MFESIKISKLSFVFQNWKTYEIDEFLSFKFKNYKEL